MQQETNSKIAKQASSIVTKLATTMTATEAVVCRAKASNIKDVSTERGRDPVRRKSVVCGE